MHGSTQDWELWGVFSVADHLRRRAFVADVLLYDQLVVPVPDERDEELMRKWERPWDPARQTTLLDAITAEMPGLVRRVPWSTEDDRDWRTHAEGSGLTFALAGETSRDVGIIQGADPDSLGQLGERNYLVDLTDRRRDEALRSGVPSGTIDVVAAYGSRRQFARDVEVDASGTTLLAAFAWPLMVPSSSTRSDRDLLKDAAELAMQDETREYRIAYHAWRRRQLAGASSDDKHATQELGETIARYHSAMRRSRIATRTRLAVMTVVTAGTAVLAAPVVPLVVGVVAAGGNVPLEHYLRTRVLRTKIPDYLYAGALFHEARERFGWY